MINGAESIHVPQDDAEAVRWYRLAAEQGHSKAQYNLGLMNDTGEGVPQDGAEAVLRHLLDAEQRHARAALGNLPTETIPEPPEPLVFALTGWVWVDTYPFLYSARTSSWLYLFPRDEGLWVLDMVSNEWTLIE